MSVITWDVETASADKLFTYGAPEFVRLCGADPRGKPELTVDPLELIKWLDDADWITGHNIMGFDLLALCYYFKADWEKLSAKSIDTLLLERLRFPPEARDTAGSTDKYDLDHVAERLGVAGKTDDIRKLAHKYGGYDQIPLDDEEYQRYLLGDIESSRQVFDKMRDAWNPYAQREHKCASIFGRMSLNGFKVDVPLLTQRLDTGEERKQQALHILSEDYDLPLGRFGWKGRGKDKEESWEQFASPLASLEGREWLIDVYEAYGVSNPPVTDTGRLSIAAEDLRLIAENQAAHPDLRRIIELMSVVTTTRTVYQTVESYLTADGRVHPLINMNQASGRSGVTNPGLTVFGKRDGRWRERDIFIPEDGHLLVSFDMRQLDMRAVAALSQDPAYIEMCQPGKDLHEEIAIQIFGDKLYRSKAKPIGHGYNYGIGANRLITAGHDPELVKRFFSEMARKFPGVTEWQSKSRKSAQSGEIQNSFGRKMRCNPERAWTQGPALQGQGEAADIMKESLLRMPAEFRPYYKMYVHDEVVFSFPVADAEELSREAERAMTFEHNGVPILCDRSPMGSNWGEVSAK